jgi:hypothetical protein
LARARKIFPAPRYPERQRSRAGASVRYKSSAEEPRQPPTASARQKLKSPPARRVSLLLPPTRHRATMPPRRRGSSGFVGVRERPNDTFYAELRAGGQRFGLGTYDTAQEAARAYDAAAWCAGHNPRTMNFWDARNAEQAAELAPPMTLLTAEQRRHHQQQQRRLDIAASDE